MRATGGGLYARPPPPSACGYPRPVRIRLRRALAATALLLAGCGGGAPAAAPVQDHVHSAVGGHAAGEILLGTHYGLRISTDGGRTWPSAGDLGRTQIRLLVAAGDGYVAVTGAEDGSSATMISADGRHWSGVAGMPAGRPVSALVAGATPGSVWAEVTDVGYTAAFCYAAAVVTELGGPMSHAAVVAREFGFPCVVDVQGATRSLPSGALVEVDGTTGEIRMLGPAAIAARPASGDAHGAS